MTINILNYEQMHVEISGTCKTSYCIFKGGASDRRKCSLEIIISIEIYCLFVKCSFRLLESDE